MKIVKTFSEIVEINIEIEEIDFRFPENQIQTLLDSEDFKGWLLDRGKNFGYGYHVDYYNYQEEDYCIHFRVSFEKYEKNKN